MDIVLGVSMTPTTVRLVLVEGEKADGITVDHDTFDVAPEGGSANVAEQVLAAVLGTKESAQASGHHLKSIGVTWSDHAEASALRDALAAHDIDDVMLVDEGHAAASLAQAVGRAVGYETTEDLQRGYIGLGEHFGRGIDREAECHPQPRNARRTRTDPRRDLIERMNRIALQIGRDLCADNFRPLRCRTHDPPFRRGVLARNTYASTTRRLRS